MSCGVDIRIARGGLLKFAIKIFVDSCFGGIVIAVCWRFFFNVRKGIPRDVHFIEDPGGHFIVHSGDRCAPSCGAVLILYEEIIVVLNFAFKICYVNITQLAFDRVGRFSVGGDVSDFIVVIGIFENGIFLCAGIDSLNVDASFCEFTFLMRGKF